MRFILCALILALAGCNPGVFKDLEDEAPTRVFTPPDEFAPRTFGVHLAATRGSVGVGTLVDASRVAAVGGEGQPFAIYSVWTGTEPDFAVNDSGCKDPGDCPQSTGADVAGIPEWAGSGACFVVTSPGLAETRIVCDGQDQLIFHPADDHAGEELGRSVAGIPVEGSPLGVAILGAPGAREMSGALYRLENGASTHTEITLPPELALAPGDRFGENVAVGLLSPDASTLADAVLVAVTAQGSHRVYLFAVGNDDAAGVTAELLGCASGGEGFGAALAIGDLTGDGDPEIVIGEALEASGRSDALQVFHRTAFKPDACLSADPSDDPVGETVPCPADLGLECAGSGFGASVAIGDVNADGVGDLLVGAPNSTAGNKANAGAAYLLSGNMGGVDQSVSQVDVALLVDSRPEAGARVGFDVVMARSHLGVSAPERDEPVASAPGAAKLFLFLCSDLEDLANLADARCLELR
jgi:hypothetical protein